jgi:ketosteroid isomerase-like protein
VQQNVEIVRAIYAAWDRGEVPGPADLLDDAIEYVNPPDALEPGTRRGLGEFSAAVGRVFEGWESWKMQPEEMTAVGDEVAVRVSYRARGRASGVEVEGRESALWTVKDGRAVRYAWFHGEADAANALRAP